jgi:hypothetical protein
MNLDSLVANAVLGIDTLWGGDVMCPSGTGRFIADSWFSDQPLPAAYTHPSADAVRACGGVSAGQPAQAPVRAYLQAVNLRAALNGLAAEANTPYLRGLADAFGVMWDLAMELLGEGDPVPYERCVRASTGHGPTRSDPAPKRDRVAALLGEAGYKGDPLDAVDAWRAAHRAPMAGVRRLGAAFISHYDALSAAHVAPFLPPEMRTVPRANIEFLPIRDAWFSGSMNYLGRRRPVAYEATYEINASLQISLPEFEQLVSHEVVPGHVTTFAYLQDLYLRGKVGFEASVLTMNTRGAALHEGIANNAILMAHGVTEVDQLPDPDLQIGVLLALLQDDAKNQSSYLTWHEGIFQPEVAATLRRDFLVSHERAEKLSGAWGRHPLLGRMYLPAYRAGTEKVAELRRKYPPERFIPAVYGCAGLVDVVTIESALA